jgi:hypothetical protein
MFVVRWKRLGKWRNNSRFLLHDNVPAHRSVLIKYVLAKNNVTTLEHSQYSRDFASADFFLFPRLKLTLKGWRFCNAIGIIKNATKVLKRLSQNGFQGCFQHLYSHWPKRIVAQGDYSEVNAA